jgi:hypothetical protein
MSALDAAGEIYGHFNRQFSEGILDSWTSSQEKYHNAPCFDISNWYLTPAKETMGLQDTPFHKGVDPRGILCGMANGDGTCSYVHTEDNQVQYFTAYRDGNGNRKSVNCFFQDRCFKLTLAHKRLGSNHANHRCFVWET